MAYIFFPNKENQDNKITKHYAKHYNLYDILSFSSHVGTTELRPDVITVDGAKATECSTVPKT
jgi:hypothetical protein